MKSLYPLVREAKHQWPRLFDYIRMVRQYFEPDILSPGYAELIIKRASKPKRKLIIRKEY